VTTFRPTVERSYGQLDAASSPPIGADMGGLPTAMPLALVDARDEA